METKSISKQALQRLPYYIDYLNSLAKNEITYVSSPAIAYALDLNEVQVRKDLAKVCETSGIPKKGFIVSDLIAGLEKYLGYNNATDAILIGAGKLGAALMSYKGFEDYGLNIVAAFDTNEKIIDGKKIFNISKLPDICERLKIKIAILTLPSNQAQAVCDLLIENGILAIWNFAPTHLKVPDDILVHNENMASSLALLSNHLSEKLKVIK